MSGEILPGPDWSTPYLASRCLWQLWSARSSTWSDEDMRNFQKLVAIFALSGMCLAAPTPSDSEAAAKKSTKHHAVKAVKEG